MTGSSFWRGIARGLSVAALLMSTAASSSSSLPALRGAASVRWDAPATSSRFAIGADSRLPISRRPTQGGGDPRGDGYLVASTYVCGPHICVHWVSSTADAPPAADVNHNQIPDQVDRTLTAFEVAWTAEVVRMGFRAPKSDITSPDHGPNGRLDVYLADVGFRDLGGYVATDDPHASDGGYLYRDYSAYVVVDNDFSPAQLGISEGQGGLQVTAAHEFFHAVQYAYDSGEDGWLVEGTAAWMEDQVVDDVNANRIWLHESPLTHPCRYSSTAARAWTSTARGSSGDSSARATGAPARRWCAVCGSWPPTLPGIPICAPRRPLGRRSLRDIDRSLPALVGFGVWNLARRGRSTTRGRRTRPRRSTGVIGSTGVPPIAGWSTLHINHLSTAAVSFQPGSGSPAWASLRLTLDAPARRTGSAARLLALPPIGIPPRRPGGARPER